MQSSALRKLTKEVPQKSKNRTTLWLSHITAKYIPPKNLWAFIAELPHISLLQHFLQQSNQECSSKDEQKTFSIYVYTHTHNSWMLFSWINNRLWQPEITVRNEISQTHKCYVVCQVWKSLGIKNRLESCKDCLRRVRREEEGNGRRNWVWRRSQCLVYRYETTIQIREYCNTVSHLIL